MSYQLGQTPVPTWAVPKQQPLQLDLDQLPSFLLAKDTNNKPASNLSPSGHPVFLKQAGRWNSVLNYSIDDEAEKSRLKKEGTVDPSILDNYNLTKSWENRMDQVKDEESGIAKLDRYKAKFLKNLAANPFFPIVLRGSASAFAIITLGLACEVFVQTKKIDPSLFGENLSSHSPTASTIFCIVISIISILYLLFSLWDETFGQPLGLRPSQSKIKFVAIDMALVCLNAANLAVAFDTMITKDFICPAVQNRYICRLQKATVAFIFVTLVVWFMTFLVSAFRMIDRATH